MRPKSGSPVRICIDRVISIHHKVVAANIAIAENRENEPPPLVVGPGASFHVFKMALLAGKKWQKSRKLGVRFLDGSKKQRSQTQKYAQVWSQFADISLDFSAAASPDIRVSFVADSGSWSGIGTDCLVREFFPLEEPTMNFGWLRDDTSETEWRRVVLHEFGHALGAIHEHQNPTGGIKWNLPEVYKTFSGPPNFWSKEEINFNIVQKYAMNQLNATKFDIKSIMLYAFPAKLITGGKSTPNNTDLSPNDKKFIGMMYPKVTVGAPGPKLVMKGAKESEAPAAAPRRVHPSLALV